MWRVQVTLRNLTLLTVGASYSVSGTTDVATLRFDGRVVIPGTSFKGALRTAAHMAAPAVGMRSCGEIEPEAILRAHAESGVCDVCRIFGIPGHPLRSASAIRVTDLIPTTDVPVVTLTRTSIDPRRGRVQEGKLFTIEVVPLCTTFEGEILVREADHLKLILAALDSLRLVGIGKGALVDLKVSISPEPNESELGEVGMPLLNSLRDWRWDLCEWF